MEDSTDWTTVSVRLPVEKREKWEAYLEESETSNLSHLIRLSVKHEIDGTADSTDSRSPETAIGREEVNGIVDGIESLQQAVDGVQQRLSSIEREMEMKSELDIQDAVFNALPTTPEDYDPESTDAPGPGDWGLTASEVAKRVAHDESTVKDSLDQLTEISGQVQSAFVPQREAPVYWARE